MQALAIVASRLPAGFIQPFYLNSRTPASFGCWLRPYGNVEVPSRTPVMSKKPILLENFSAYHSLLTRV